MLSKYGAILFLLSFHMKLVTSIRCYECSSANNTMCLEPALYDAETLDKYLPTTHCGSGVVSSGHHAFFCRKIMQTIFHKGYEPDVRVTRTCGWIRHHRDCYMADNEDHLETVCQCFTDDCNRAHGVHPVRMMGSIALLLLLRSLS
ncbi:uncharacterized protein LOC114242351 [Bombyx mandarina]|uniref:Uncharacterized protein LOC114242351 n=1 Tax=Bombyx mandarina TaxID=7092 RepID=A0A6J2JJ24_BOMMA|nr:uncharacterized protein LOC114242351 [Bombyx mandarina]XP_028029278.1 uncharacterized protein LOC114242351 [Bombyx mandarina]